jgi:hypothetical protein
MIVDRADKPGMEIRHGDDDLELAMKLVELEHHYVQLGLQARSACEYVGVEFDPATWVVSEIVRGAYIESVNPDFLLDWFASQEQWVERVTERLVAAV